MSDMKSWRGGGKERGGMGGWGLVALGVNRIEFVEGEEYVVLEPTYLSMLAGYDGHFHSSSSF